jgi:hypothetical protein
MSLPRSFTTDGLYSPPAIEKYKGVLIGTEGESESGKTEFMASGPGPGVILCVDRGHVAMLDNPHPPTTRCPDFAFKVIDIPLQTQTNVDGYKSGWAEFKSWLYKALSNADCRTVGIDTDSASWELQQLAEFGKLTQIPPLMRTGVKAARRAIVAKCADSGKIVVGSNMLTDEYVTVVDGEGRPTLKDGKEQQEKTGKRRRQGFPDQDYLWQIQIRHLVDPAKENPRTGKKIPRQFGIRILKCKVNGELVGEELWGPECNMESLLRLCYPNIPKEKWGFK